MAELTKDARLVLQWLIDGEGGLLGECKGVALDELIDAHYAIIGGKNPSRAGDDWRIVWPTDAGRAALQSHNEGRDGVGNDNDGREDSQP